MGWDRLELLLLSNRNWWKHPTEPFLSTTAVSKLLKYLKMACLCSVKWLIFLFYFILTSSPSAALDCTLEGPSLNPWWSSMRATIHPVPHFAGISISGILGVVFGNLFFLFCKNRTYGPKVPREHLLRTRERDVWGAFYTRASPCAECAPFPRVP